MILTAFGRVTDVQVEIIGRTLDFAADALGWLSDWSGDWSETCRWWAGASRLTP